MPENKVEIDPRYMKYNKDEVEAILDGSVQMVENDDPTSLMNNQNV